MAAIDFPTAPAIGQAFTAGNGVTYVWNGLLWVASGSAAPGGDFCAIQSSGFPSIGATATTLIPTPVITGNASGAYSTSTGRYVPPAGRYMIYGSWSMTSGATSFATLWLRKNGTTLMRSEEMVSSANATCKNAVSLIVDCNGTDWLDIQGASSAGSSTSYHMLFQAYPISGIKGPPGDYPSGLKLYSEQVLASPAAEMRVTIPPNAKKIEIVYETRNVGLVDAMMRFQAVEGSTPYVGVTYVNGLHFQSQNTPVAYASPVQAGFIEVTGRGFSGTLRPMINTVLNSLSGDGTFSGFTAGAVTTYNGQVSFMYISGIPSMSTITGWRLANTTAVNFQAGSFMRCFAAV